MLQKKNQVRSANTEAVRSTVYLPPKLHAAILAITKKDGAVPKAGSLRARVTQSQVILQACSEYVRTQHPGIAKRFRVAA
jgi:hypothetical protein